MNWHLISAIRFAVSAHKNQRRGGPKDIPYVDHCLEVMQRLVSHGVTDLDALRAAVLHDVLEDCPVTVQELRDEFGLETTQLVQWLTLPDSCQRDHFKKRIHQIEMMSVMNVHGISIKIADKTSNVYSVVTNPPKWGLKAIQSYCDTSMDVVRAGMEASVDGVVQRLGSDFVVAYNAAKVHYGW